MFGFFERLFPEVLTPETDLSDPALADWVFVVPAPAKGWILDAICREIGARVKGDWRVAYYDKHLSVPRSKNYFFAHYWNYMDMIKRQPELADSCCFVWYTHPRKTSYSIDDIVSALSRITQVIPTCHMWRDSLLESGLPPEKATVVLGAADPVIFRSHKRTGRGQIGLCSSFYDRKRPDLLRDLVQIMPHRRFLLIGRKWEEYQDFDTLLSADNFSYVTTEYENYPKQYAEMDVFLSVSDLEGGPIPLVEAMMCNVVPVASRTGFAPDLIKDGENGFVFDIDASAEQVRDLIEMAFQIKRKIRPYVRELSWKRFATKIIAMGRR